MSAHHKIALCAVALAALNLTPACALLKKPTPLTQLQLSLPAVELNWPARLELGSVKARGVLQSDRLIVTNGALVMQHGGLRWVAAPATQLAEQLAIARITTSTRSIQKAAGKAVTIDVWLSDFNITVNPTGDTSVAVSASGAIRCANAKIASDLAPAAIVLPLNSTDPQRIAERFNAAATQVITTLLARIPENCKAAVN